MADWYKKKRGFPHTPEPMPLDLERLANYAEFTRLTKAGHPWPMGAQQLAALFIAPEIVWTSPTHGWVASVSQTKLACFA